ncbi:hypothetical protein Hamer_G030189, partial [Homarus americanus]
SVLPSLLHVTVSTSHSYTSQGVLPSPLHLTFNTSSGICQSKPRPPSSTTGTLPVSHHTVFN